MRLRDVQGTIKASGAFIDEYHLSQHISFDNQRGRFGSISNGGLPMADVLHVTINPTKVVWAKTVVRPFDNGKLFLCHSENCKICTTQALPGLGRERVLGVKAGAVGVGESQKGDPGGGTAVALVRIRAVVCVEYGNYLWSTVSLFSGFQIDLKPSTQPLSRIASVFWPGNCMHLAQTSGRFSSIQMGMTGLSHPASKTISVIRPETAHYLPGTLSTFSMM
jgi:hypothetical protein